MDGDGPPPRCYDDYWLAVECHAYDPDRREIILWVREHLAAARRRAEESVLKKINHVQ